ncbi:hypothetical protein Rhopal_001394-T1 [Rhodotorula paludigena]|uniref:PWWP domain-containing protein n=1 Tax=Rhodotorula paludigena TaxID=86838 RepID=A0AAV5GDP8_9BASI|nr:hypothetical protein Rhopal_001394-T1 [Rhodotorula paludigena]
MTGDAPAADGRAKAAVDETYAMADAQATTLVGHGGAQDTFMRDEHAAASISSFTAYRDDAPAETVGPASGQPATQPASSAGLELPPAAQPERPVTPPRMSSYTTHPSSGSSQATLTAGTQNATLSPPKSTFQLTQTEIADESPDPLRIIPTPSAASSAGRSHASGFRARSQSVEPHNDLLQSSPTRSGVSRHRSKTPVPASDNQVENVDPTSSARRSVRAPSASIRVRASGMGSLAEADSDDELAMGAGSRSAPGPAHSKQAGHRSSGGPARFDCVEIPVSASSAMIRTASASSTRSLSGGTRPASPTVPKVTGRATRKSSDMEVDSPVDSNKRSRTPQKFELVLETRSRTHAAIPPSSPLSSLPPSQAERTSPAPAPAAATPPRASPKRTRRARSSAGGSGTAETGEEQDPAPASSEIDNPSPKKKARRASTLPTIKKAAAPVSTEAKKRATARGKGKAKEQTAEVADDGVGSDDKAGRAETQPPARKGRGRAKKDDEVPTPVREAAAEMNRGTRRRKSLRESLRETSPSSEMEEEEEEEEDVDEDDSFVEKPAARKRGRPSLAKAKQPVPSPSSSPTKAGKARARQNGKTTKGKDKAKEEDDLPAPTSSPSKTSLLPPPSSFASQILGNDKATPQTSQQRAKGWSLNALPRGRPLWVHIRKDDQDGFWWPGELAGFHWEKPLRVKLYLDQENKILEHSAELVSFEAPSHDDIVTFRNPTKLAFDRLTFRDSPDVPSPGDEVFGRVLETALEKDSAGDDDDDDLLLPPSSLGQKGAATNGKGRSEATHDSSDESSAASEAEKTQSDDEEWLRGGGEDAGFIFPFICLGRQKGAWWAARAARYEPPSPTKSGAPRKNATGRFVLEWTDGSLGRVTRKNLLTSRDKDFFTVNIGETKLDIRKGYFDDLREYCTVHLPPKFQRIISEDFPIAQKYNDDFFAGGARRDQLAQKSAFGEMTPEMLEEVQQAIDDWASGAANGGDRPTGSQRYEQLGDTERRQYRADVLLSIAVVLNYAADEDLYEKAEEDLKAQGQIEPSDEDIEVEAFKLARSQLELRSATNTVVAMRQSRQIVQASQAQRNA